MHGKGADLPGPGRNFTQGLRSPDQSTRCPTARRSRAGAPLKRQFGGNPLWQHWTYLQAPTFGRCKGRRLPVGRYPCRKTRRQRGHCVPRRTSFGASAEAFVGYTTPVPCCERRNVAVREARNIAISGQEVTVPMSGIERESPIPVLTALRHFRSTKLDPYRSFPVTTHWGCRFETCSRRSLRSVPTNIQFSVRHGVTPRISISSAATGNPKTYS